MWVALNLLSYLVLPLIFPPALRTSVHIIEIHSPKKLNAELKGVCIIIASISFSDTSMRFKSYSQLNSESYSWMHTHSTSLLKINLDAHLSKYPTNQNLIENMIHKTSSS